MIKVILETESVRKVDLFPEYMPVREVLSQLQFDPDAARYFVNGRLLTEEDLEKDLRECCECEDVQFCALPKPDEDIPTEDGSAPGTPEGKEQAALRRVCELLCEAVATVNTVLKTSNEEDLPF